MPKLGRPEETLENTEIEDGYKKRVQAMKNQDVGVGWYQDSDGGLFHFNGTVWDVVPEELKKRLEYLG
jgi:hypothetical protein